MAKPRVDPKTGKYFLRQIVLGKRLFIDLDTGNATRAEKLSAKIQERIWHLQHGLASLPEGADVLQWLKTGSTAPKESAESLGNVIDSYASSRPIKSTAPSTRATEDIHLAHLRRLMTPFAILSSVNAAEIRKYISSRLKEGVSGPTIRKELYVFRRVWRWAKAEGLVSGDPPTAAVPKGEPKEPFRTFAEISRLVKECPPARSAELWECCVLDSGEVTEFLEYVRGRRGDDWFYPVVVACAFAGIRRSEWIRSRVEDWHLSTAKLTVRERKRVHDKHGSLRTVDLHPELIRCIKEYLQSHPGGSVMFCDKPNEEITRDIAADRWRRVMINSEWANLNGYHTLRHSFASNLAAAGVSEHLIDRWMGHQTEEQRERYRHFLPSERDSAISQLGYKLGGKRS